MIPEFSEIFAQLNNEMISYGLNNNQE